LVGEERGVLDRADLLLAAIPFATTLPAAIAPVAAGTGAARRRRDLPYVIGGRDFVVSASGTTLALVVGDERYAELALGIGDDPELAGAGIVTALAVAALGVRMRPDWVELGARAAAARQ